MELKLVQGLNVFVFDIVLAHQLGFMLYLFLVLLLKLYEFVNGKVEFLAISNN